MALTTVALVKDALQVEDLYTDEQIQPAVDASIALIEEYVTAASFVAEPAPMCEAATALAVDIFMTITAPGGQIVGADFQPSPFRFGRSLMGRFQGLLQPYMDVTGMIG